MGCIKIKIQANRQWKTHLERLLNENTLPHRQYLSMMNNYQCFKQQPSQKQNPFINNYPLHPMTHPFNKIIQNSLQQISKTSNFSYDIKQPSIYFNNNFNSFTTKMRRQDKISYRSPQPHINAQLDEHASKIKELLRYDLKILEQENSVLKIKCRKMDQLEDKVQIVLRQNSELLIENQKISKLMHQKKSQLQSLKTKYQTTLTQRLGNQSQYEFQLKKLLLQIQNLRTQLQQSEKLKITKIDDLKSQHQLELQSLKRQSTGDQQVHEHQLRKIKDQLDKQTTEHNEIITKVKRQLSDSEYEGNKLAEQKQKLRKQLIELDLQRKKDIESLKNKLNTNYLSDIEILKKNHLVEMESLEIENARLKQYLETKNKQLELIASKSTKHLEQQLLLLSKENQTLRLQQAQDSHQIQLETINLKTKLSQIHDIELQELKLNQQKYVEIMQLKIIKLENDLRDKQQQLQQTTKQKISMRQIFQSQTSRLKQDIDGLVIKIKDLETRYLDSQLKHDQKLKQKNEHIQYLDKLNQTQKQNNQKQQNVLKQIIEHQKVALENQKINYYEKQQNMKQELAELKRQIDNLKDQLYKQRADKQKKIKQLQNQLQNTTNQLQTKIDTNQAKITKLQRQIQSMKKTIQIKQNQIKNLQQRIRLIDDRQKKLSKQNQDLKNKLAKKDQKMNEMLQQQKTRMESSFQYALDSLKTDHQAALKLQQNKQDDLNQKLKKKEKQMTDLLKSYKIMRDQLETITQQQANKKQLTIKFPGATADLIAIKNLFDVYLKTKVLDICQNRDNEANKENVITK